MNEEEFDDLPLSDENAYVDETAQTLAAVQEEGTVTRRPNSSAVADEDEIILNRLVTPANTDPEARPDPWQSVPAARRESLLAAAAYFSRIFNTDMARDDSQENDLVRRAHDILETLLPRFEHLRGSDQRTFLESRTALLRDLPMLSALNQDTLAYLQSLNGVDTAVSFTVARSNN